MKILSCQAVNFGSYSELSFDLSNIGLGLIYGPTGSGKSTILDVIAWTLYGITAKDGNADEVRSWYAEGATEASIVLDTNTGLLKVTRIRGKSNENDLYWHQFEHAEEGRLIRGKDITDTQKLLTKRLGVDSDVFIAGSYCHEFSPTGSFFTAKAKERRALFEKIADLDLPNRLAEGTTDAKKGKKKLVDQYQKQLDRLTGKIESTELSIKRTKESIDEWETAKYASINSLTKKFITFEAEKAKKLASLSQLMDKCDMQNTEALSKTIQDRIYEVNNLLKSLGNERCSECGSKKTSNKIIEYKTELDSLKDQSKQIYQVISDFMHFRHSYETESKKENTYKEQIDALQACINPFTEQNCTLKKDLCDLNEQMSVDKRELSQVSKELILLDRLYDLSFVLRLALIKNVVEIIQNNTNAYLSKYFDAEIKVAFSANDSDNLDITIQKSGYECSYKQLSKGQRGLLKLCFSVAIMEATSNKSGVHFDNLFFDEALSGLDSSLKTKAYSLFQELSKKHSSILVIDHDQTFQEMFDKRYHVTLTEDRSQVHLEES